VTPATKTAARRTKPALSPAAPGELDEASENGAAGPIEVPPILDLETLTPKRLTITIDHEAYEMRALGDFGIEEQHVITHEGEEFGRLWGTAPADLKGAEKKRMKLILDRLTTRAVDAPPEVLARLNPEQQKQVVQLFTRASEQNWQRTLETLIAKVLEARDGSTSES
jgi:hypothetical protein